MARITLGCRNYGPPTAFKNGPNRLGMSQIWAASSTIWPESPRFSALPPQVDVPLLKYVGALWGRPTSLEAKLSNCVMVRVAPDETVILLHPCTFIRCFNRDKQGVCHQNDSLVICSGPGQKRRVECRAAQAGAAIQGEGGDPAAAGRAGHDTVGSARSGDGAQTIQISRRCYMHPHVKSLTKHV